MKSKPFVIHCSFTAHSRLILIRVPNKSVYLPSASGAEVPGALSVKNNVCLGVAGSGLFVHSMKYRRPCKLNKSGGRSGDVVLSSGLSRNRGKMSAYVEPFCGTGR